MDKSPDAFRTISEVAEVLDTPAHVLRFWESRFPQIRPVKRAGGRRYYRPNDVALLSGIKRLLHDDGMTIRGVQKVLREQGVRHVAGLSGDDHSAMIEEDAEAALGAALKSFATPDPTPLPAVEVESAQVVVLETALRRAPERKPAPDSPSLFDGIELGPTAPETPIAVEADDVFGQQTEAIAAIWPEDDVAQSLTKAEEPIATPVVVELKPLVAAQLLAQIRTLPDHGLRAKRSEIAPLLDRLTTLQRRMSQPPQVGQS